MSGIEIAGLVFGAVPIVVETLKSYSLIRNKLHTCRHYSDEVEEVAAKLTSSRANFNNEVQLLRRCLKETGSTGDLDMEVNDALDESYRSCIQTVDRTKRLLDKMTPDMKKFDAILEKKSQGHSIKKLRSIVKITFNESRYERLLNRLRDRNNELHAFRLQIEALKQPSKPAGICVQYKPLPGRFQAVQATSRQLHAALHEVCPCSDSPLREHYAKLCLDAEVADEVRLDLAFSCQELDSAHGARCVTTQPHIWLYVQSTVISNLVPKIPPCDESQVSQPQNPGPTVCKPKLAKRKASSDLHAQSNRKGKSKHVQWAALPSATSAAPTPLHSERETAADLRRTKNFCDFLKRSFELRHSLNEQNCVGFLQNSCLYKHSFYFRNDLTRLDLNDEVGYTTTTFGEALEQDAYGVVKMVDQLRIALKLAISVLQYNDTPWLLSNWRLSDIKYLGTKDTVDATALKTLHLSSEISKRSNGSLMEGVTLARDAVTNETRYGIPNPTLFCLGVALLEIAHWSPIESKRISEDGDSLVLTVRRLERYRAIPLGPEYLSIAKRCLWCDFGFGNQLSEKGLQSAVYTKVVWELEELITRFSKLGL